MIKNAINKFVKEFNNKFKSSPFERRMAILENVMNEQSTKNYNLRKARNRSLKEIVFTSK